MELPGSGCLAKTDLRAARKAKVLSYKWPPDPLQSSGSSLDTNFQELLGLPS